MLWLLASFCLYVARGVHGAPTASSNPTVTIDVGTVIGTAVPFETSTVYKFLGIPFAVTPPERFSPPQPVGNLPGPMTAQTASAACIQEFMC